MPNLTDLDLSNSGIILDDSTLYNLIKLKRLNFSYTNYTIKDTKKLKNLEYLNLHMRGTHGFELYTDDIYELVNLTSLNIYNSRMGKIKTDGIYKLTKLKYLLGMMS